MSTIKVSEPQKSQYLIEDSNDYEFTPKAKITIKDDSTAAISDQGSAGARKLILNNDISITYTSYAYVYGIENTKNTSASSLTLCAGERNTKLTVNCSFFNVASDTEVYGIYSTTSLNIGFEEEQYRQAISVTGSNNAKEYAKDIYVTGIFSDSGTMTFNSALAAPITVKATNKSNHAEARGLNGNKISFYDDSLKADISATAGGKSARADAIYGSNVVTIDNVAGKVTATASSTGTGDAEANAIYSAGKIDIGSISKAVTAKATGKSYAAQANGLDANTISIDSISADISATASGTDASAYVVTARNNVAVDGDIAGKITATATATAAGQYAYAHGLYADNGTISVTGKIMKAMTVKATGKQDTAYARGIWTGTKSITLGGIAADISATASGKGAEAYAVRGYEDVQINSDMAGKITVTGTSTAGSSASATAYGICSANGAVAIKGKIAKAVTAKATSKEYWADAKGIRAYTTITLGGIAADISATASSTAAKAEAYAIYGKKDVTTGDVAGKISVTASSNADKANAYAIFSSDGKIDIDGISKSITAKATSKETTADANGLEASTISIDNISADISATATGKKGSASAIHGQSGVTIGSVAGKISSTATSEQNSVFSEAIYSDSGVVSIGSITKSVTAKATSKSEGAKCYGIESYQSTVTIGSIAADISTTASGVAGVDVYGIYGNGDVKVSGDIAGKVAATANGENICYAYGLYSVTGDISVTGAISKAMTVKATGKADSAKCFGMKTNSTSKSVILGGIAADITVTANSERSGTAYGINGGSNVTVNGDVAGKISVSATGNDYAAEAYAIEASNINLGKITKAVTVRAKSKVGGAAAHGLDGINELSGIAANIDISATGGGDRASSATAFEGTTTITGDITGKITVTATSGGEAQATANAFKGETTIEGDFTGAISVTATASYGTAEANAIYNAAGDIALKGKMTKSITVKATTRGAKAATARGIATYTGTMLVREDLGKLTVTADGLSEGCQAYGWMANTFQTADTKLTGTANVTCKNGKAYGLVAETIKYTEFKEVVATLNITVNAKIAEGIRVSGSNRLTLSGSKITVKTTNKDGGSAYALRDVNSSEAGASQVITIEKSTLTGDIDMGSKGVDELTLKDKSKITGDVIMGNDANSIELYASTLTGDISMGGSSDTLRIDEKSKVTGDVDMGDGTDDVIWLNSGSQLKGTITNANSIKMNISDPSAKKTALWEGAIDQDDFSQMNLELYIWTDEGAGAGEYTLMKDTDKWNSWGETSLNLALDGTSYGTLKYGAGKMAAGDYNVELKSGNSGKSLILAITEKA